MSLDKQCNEYLSAFSSRVLREMHYGCIQNIIIGNALATGTWIASAGYALDFALTHDQSSEIVALVGIGTTMGFAKIREYFTVKKADIEQMLIQIDYSKSRSNNL